MSDKRLTPEREKQLRALAASFNLEADCESNVIEELLDEIAFWRARSSDPVPQGPCVECDGSGVQMEDHGIPGIRGEPLSCHACRGTGRAEGGGWAHEIRLDDDGQPDDIVLRCDAVQLEHCDKGAWFVAAYHGRKRTTFWLTTKRGAAISASVQENELGAPEVRNRYEARRTGEQGGAP